MLTVLYALFAFLSPCTQTNPGSEQVIRDMYNRYHGKWFQTFTFLQTTEAYRNDSLIKKTTWYEAISFPDKFRIDFGDTSEGDAVIFRNDSVYSFSKGSLRNKGVDKNDLTFLLGGMYFHSIDEVLRIFKDLHYDLAKFHKDQWKGRAVLVVGADRADEKVNQIWIDEEKLIVVRMIKYDDNTKEEGLFENHIAAAGGWSETKAIFYINDKLVQKEFYYDCKSNPVLDAGLFDPALFGKIHWFKK